MNAVQMRGRRRWQRVLPVLPVLLAGLALSPGLARADAVGLEATLLTTHIKNQRDAPVEYYRRKLDHAGRHIYTPGVEGYYDFDLDEPIWGAGQLRIAGGQISDSVAHRLRYFAVMGRWMLVEGERLSWSLQVGPGIIARKTWRTVPGYDPDNALSESEHFLPGWEYAILPLGDLDLAYAFTERLQGVWSVFPGIPYVIMQSVGVRWAF